MGAKLFGSHLGFNLKLIDLHVGLGRVQLLRLPGCIEVRQRHGHLLRRELEPLSHLVAFSLPTHATAWNPENGEFALEGSGLRSDGNWFCLLLRAGPKRRQGPPFGLCPQITGGRCYNKHVVNL